MKLNQLKNASATKNAVKAPSAGKNVAAKAAAPKKTATPGFGRRASILAAIMQHHVDGACSWLGDSIDSKLVAQLVSKADDLKKEKLNKAGQKILTVNASRLFAWPLTGLHGDTYARMHSPKTEVRGSISLLQKHFGPTRVKIVELKDALVMATKIKTDGDCLAALQKLASS